ncbi:MAG: AAA family ATPase [Alphaproteobacteria bacterium]|nr:AAA family ATPase [Alphaproteobacteria bacterium]
MTAVPGEILEVRRTHISEVFLTRDRAYKVKRPVSLGFVDYGTRELRRAACEAEVRLNRRLAPDIYLGVVTMPDGEPAVEMVRLPDEGSLLAHLERGEVDAGTLREVGRVIGAFHRRAEASDAIAQHGSFARLDHHVRENFDQTRSHVPALVHPDVHQRCEEASLDGLRRWRETIAARTAAIRDVHGDLRLEHVYLHEGRILVIDCVEFSDAYRCSDVAMDLAFLVMDLSVRGRDDLADALVEGWLEVTGDEQALPLLPFFSAYRSIVRAKVAGMTLLDPAVDPGQRADLAHRALRHWLWALGRLVPRGEGPALLGVGGRPGTGKTTVARMLGEHGWEIVRSDVVRKELAGLAESERLDPDAYDLGSRERVYTASFRRAGALLAAGRRVVVDASFTRDAWRVELLELAARYGVPCAFVRCIAPDSVVEERLSRRSGDASDADFQVFLKALWQQESERVAPLVHTLGTGVSLDEVRERVAQLASALP